MEATAVKTIWAIDPTHSDVQFKIRHLVISTVTGQFNSFRGEIKSEDDSFEGAKAKFEADIDSISTNQADRDAHLKSADFFDEANFPNLNFVSTNFIKKEEDEYEITGNMTIRGTTKKIKLKAEYGGTMTDPYGNVKAGFEITGSIKRSDFGLNWNAVTEAGGIVVSDEVKLILNVQFVKNS